MRLAPAQIIHGVGEVSSVGVAFRIAPAPIVTNIYDLPEGTDLAAVSDIAAGDLDHDGRMDLVVAWFATDYDDFTQSKRFLSIFWGNGSHTPQRTDLNLYIQDPDFLPLSIFFNGTSSVALGDFDGDGDLDIAVMPFFGDELWVFENLGGRQFNGFIKYPFDINTPGNFITPPRAVAADIDGDGRAELIYIVDPQFYVDGRVIHIWTTHDSIANMQRTYWEPTSGVVNTTATRSLIVGDFDLDGRPDICFAGSEVVGDHTVPLLTVWSNFNRTMGTFAATNIYPDAYVTDLVKLPAVGTCRPELFIFDNSGSAGELLSPSCTGPIAYTRTSTVDGLAGLSFNQGVSAVVADVNGDGMNEVVVKQKLGDLLEPYKVDLIQFRPDDGDWSVITPTQINAMNFAGDTTNPILQPRDLLTVDLFGNSLPELVAAWGPDMVTPPPNSIGSLRFAIWPNGCQGDVDRSGQTNMTDLNIVLGHYGEPAIGAAVDADVSKNGIIDLDDLTIVMSDYGCAIGG